MKIEILAISLKQLVFKKGSVVRIIDIESNSYGDQIIVVRDNLYQVLFTKIYNEGNWIALDSADDIENFLKNAVCSY